MSEHSFPRDNADEEGFIIVKIPSKIFLYIHRTMNFKSKIMLAPINLRKLIFYAFFERNKF